VGRRDRAWGGKRDRAATVCRTNPKQRKPTGLSPARTDTGPTPERPRHARLPLPRRRATDPVVPVERNPRAGPSCNMLSGVKLVPRDQILSGRKHGSGGGSDSDSSGGKRWAKRSKGGRDKREKGNRRRKHRRRYSSEDESGSDTDDSIGEEEEADVSRSKRRGKHRRRRHDFSDDDSESSESDCGRGTTICEFKKRHSGSIERVSEYRSIGYASIGFGYGWVSEVSVIHSYTVI